VKLNGKALKRDEKSIISISTYLLCRYIILGLTDKVSVKYEQDTSMFTLVYIRIITGIDVSTLLLLMVAQELVD
jgi:hypothetical protein